MIHKVNLKTILTDLFNYYNEAKISYCLLRNYDSLPDEISSWDIDILISSQNKKENKKIIRDIVKKYNLIVYSHYIDDRYEQFFFYRRLSGNKIFNFILDIFYNSELFGIKLIDGKTILSSRLVYKNFYIADELYAFIDKWLYIYLLNTQLPDRYRDDFSRIVLERADEVKQILKKIFGKRKGELLFEELLEKDFNNVPKVSKAERFRVLFRCALKDPFYHIWHIPLFLYYRIKYLLFPKGMFISLCGPDGCGKTTVLEILLNTLNKLYRMSPNNVYHFRPSLLPRIANLAQNVKIISKINKDYSNPYRAKPSKYLGSIARLSYYITDYLLGYFLKVRPILIRRELVIFDRYFYDMVADADRSRISMSFKLLSAFFHFIPLPNFAFFIFASPLQIEERKQELSIDRIELLNNRYTELTKLYSNFFKISNERDPKEAAAKIVDIIMEKGSKKFDAKVLDKDINL